MKHETACGSSVVLLLCCTARLSLEFSTWRAPAHVDQGCSHKIASLSFLHPSLSIPPPTPPPPSRRHNSFKRHLPRQMQVGSLDLGNDYVLEKDEKSSSLGRIQPELYQQKTQESEDSSKNGSSKNCGSINFSLKYDYENEALLVNIIKAVNLPAKDLCGTSDPYVKIYLLPDRKKFQTRVHRKTLNPTFSESFQFPVPYDELPVRKLHMSVFDFDRFSRHDMIGEVVLDNLFETLDVSRETNIWRDIQYATSVRNCRLIPATRVYVTIYTQHKHFQSGSKPSMGSLRSASGKLGG